MPAESRSITPPPGHRRSLAVALTVTALAKLAILALGRACQGQWWLAHLGSDLSTWRQFFHLVLEGQIPYVHFPKEYPVGAALLYRGLLVLIGDPDDNERILVVHVLVMSAVDVLNAWLFHRSAWRLAPARALLLTLCFSLNATALVLSPLRFEPVILSFVLLGLDAHLRGRPRVAALHWALGSTLKWFPVFFLAAQEWRAFMVLRRRWQWLGAALVLAGVTLTFNLPFALRDWQEHHHLAHWLHPYLFHAQRPLYWDTLLAVGQLWLGPLPVERFAGLWSLGLMALALFVRPRQSLVDKGVLICLATLVCNRVYSTQFHLWFYPLLLLGAAHLAAPELRRLLGHFVVLDLLNIVVYPFAFARADQEMQGFRPWGAIESGGPGTLVFSLAIVLRTFAVIWLAIRLLRRPDPEAAEATGDPPRVPSRAARPA